MSLFGEIKFYLKRIIKRRFYKILKRKEYEKTLDSIEKEVLTISSSLKKDSRKILVGPSFSIYPTSFVLDRLMALAMRLRGIEVIPIYCDAIQSVECNYVGGNWGGGKKFKSNCNTCVLKSESLWHKNSFPLIKLSRYLKKVDIIEIDTKLEKIPEGEWLYFIDDGMPLGQWAKDILVNNYLVGNYHLINNHEFLGKAHLRNLLLVKQSYIRILEKVKPDRVISNDCYYGLWAILQELCKRRRIPYYSSWPVTKDRIVFAFEDSSMKLDFRKPWPSFSSKPLTELQIQIVKDWLNNKGNRGLLIDTTVIGDHQNDSFELSRINKKKPTALLASNVIWDMAALNKQIIFNDMIEWIAETIEWFRHHSEYQLVIKPHPAETNPSVPETYETVYRGLKERGITCPDNVFLLSSNVKLAVYDLLPITTLGLVHTTSVGFEMAALGIPIITSAMAPYRGFGFTYDPKNKQEYFDLIRSIFDNTVLIKKSENIDLAFKFILFYQFHYYSKLGLFEGEWGKSPVIRIKSAKELLPDNNKHLDYIINSIINALPIVSENRWPEES